MTENKKTCKIFLGYTDYEFPGKKVNSVWAVISLKDDKYFSACAHIWNSSRTDYLIGGQYLDTINDNCPDIKSNPIWQKIYRLWKLYHLNDMHAGTVEQEEALDKWWASTSSKNNIGKGASYDMDCEYLKSIGLYEVEYNGKPYRYGTGWLKRDIPEEDLNQIKELLNHRNDR